MNNATKVAIIGDGPIGSALAAYLGKANIRCCLFSPGVRPELVVGESLVPAIIPILQELDIEKEVSSYSTYKPGASFFLTPERETVINFERAGFRGSNYSYNVPRDKFDQTLLNCAKLNGCQIINAKAKLLVTQSEQLGLAQDSLELAAQVLGGEPTLIVDATGRNRLSAKLLKIGEKVGKRKDSAIFAHLEHVELKRPGNIHVNRLKSGWSWRIPLPGRVSLGIVIPAEKLKNWGSSVEEQYDNLIKNEVILREYCGQAKRITRVMNYNNYQLISDRFFGQSWVTVGDAAGFIDPIFSSGLIVGLSGAKKLSQAIIKGATQSHLHQYETYQKAQLAAWQNVVNSFYNGQLFGLMRAGDLYAEHKLLGYLVSFLERRILPVFLGTLSAYSLSFMITQKLLVSEIAVKFGKRLRVG